jgi:hypothetical protein
MSSSLRSQPIRANDEDIPGIFRSLKRGVGREKVNEANVDSLIALAREHGEIQLEYLLREWRSDCGEDVDASGLEGLPKFPPPQ